MNRKKSLRSIIIRNGVVFLLVYVFMMGAVTYVAAVREERRLWEVSYRDTKPVMEELIMGARQSDLDQPPDISAGQLILRLNAIVQKNAQNGIYSKVAVYNGIGEQIAHTGNFLFLDRYDSESNSYIFDPRQIYYLDLDEYMSVDEINAFFPQGDRKFPVTNIRDLSIEVTGRDSGQGAIIPYKLERFCGIYDHPRTYHSGDLIDEKAFSSITSDAELFGRGFGYFECLDANYKMITKTDRKRFKECAERIEGALFDNGPKSENPIIQSKDGEGSFSDGWTHIFYTRNFDYWDDSLYNKRLQVFVSDSENNMATLQLWYCHTCYPVEVVIPELIPIYILSFLIIVILMLVLSIIMNDIFKRQAELEIIRRDFTNAIAHELKNPLAIIRNYSEGLQEKINEEKRDHYLQVIIDETEHMDSMVLEMLALSQLESGIKLNRQPHDLDQITARTLARYQGEIDKKDIDVQIVSPADCLIDCDEKWIEKVVSNFLNNAVRHTPESGRIRVSITHSSFGVCFLIENSGENIPPEKIKHIWDAFYKADEARSQSKGTGLGLSAVKTILTAHGFKYGVENTESGVAFWFTA